jgi:hypothetical protein
MLVPPLLEQRFWSNVERRGPDECWPWTGSSGGKGYGLIPFKGRNQRATHVSLIIAGNGRPSPQHCACHACDNPTCVNPRHLWWGTQSENMRDCVSKGRHTPAEAKARGSAHGLSKLTENDAREIKRLLALGYGSRRLAPRFGVVRNTIARIAQGKTWKHV